MPPGKEALVRYAELLPIEPALYRLEQVDRDVADDSEVFGGIAHAYPAIVLPEGNIEHPVETIFNSPVTSGGVERCLRREVGTRCDVVAALEGCLAGDGSFRLDEHEPAELAPLVEGAPHSASMSIVQALRTSTRPCPFSFVS